LYLAQVLGSFGIFSVALLVFGLGVGAAQQLRLAAADMFPPERRAEGLGYVLTGSLVGAMGGPLLIAAAQFGAPGLGLDAVAVAWLLVPVLIIPTAVLIGLVQPDPRSIGMTLSRYYPGLRVASAPLVPGVSPSLRTLFADPPRRIAIANSIGAYATMSMMMALTPLSLAHHGAGLSEISLSVALHVVGMFAFSLPLGRLADVVGRRPVLLGGGLLNGIGALFVALSPLYWTATAGIFIVGVGWSCANVASTAILVDRTTPAERGRAIGINDMLAGAASVIAPLLGGVLVELAGMSSLAIASVVFLLLPVIMTLSLSDPRRVEATW
jgi:MFS family permease